MGDEGGGRKGEEGNERGRREGGKKGRKKEGRVLIEHISWANLTPMQALMHGWNESKVTWHH